MQISGKQECRCVHLTLCCKEECNGEGGNDSTSHSPEVTRGDFRILML